MSDRWDEFSDLDERRHGRRRSSKRWARSTWARGAHGLVGRSLAQSEEQKLYRQASRRAAAKLSFVTHFVTYGSVVVMLLFVAGFRAAFYTAFGWGIFVVLHYFAALVAPNLRRRFIAHEVSREVEQNVTRERRALEGRARPLPGAALGLHRPRDPQPHHRGQEPRAANGRGPRFPRERGVRRRRPAGARPRRALHLAPAALRP